MPVTVYASTADFFRYGLATTALGSATTEDVEASLEAASSFMDGFFNGRYNLPFSSVSLEVTMWCCHIAAYLFLTAPRGYNPAAAADENVIARYNRALDYLDKTQRRAHHPVVVEVASKSAYEQPFALSSSVINMNGRVGANRGW